MEGHSWKLLPTKFYLRLPDMTCEAPGNLCRCENPKIFSEPHRCVNWACSKM